MGPMASESFSSLRAGEGWFEREEPLLIISSFRDFSLKRELFDLRAGWREIRVYRDM